MKFIYVEIVKANALTRVYTHAVVYMHMKYIQEIYMYVYTPFQFPIRIAGTCNPWVPAAIR